MRRQMTSASSTEQQRLAAWATTNWNLSRDVDTSVIELTDSRTGNIGDEAFAALRDRIKQQGWAVYECGERTGRATVAALCDRFALGPADRTLTGPEDGLVELREALGGSRGRYTPYSRHALGWHTDGYYNPLTRTVRAFVLHCLRPAAHGGANAMIDPRQVAKRIYALDSALLVALGVPDMMSIPANTKDNAVLRAEISVPVFAIAEDGELVMRFTNRSTHIRWRGGALFERARAALLEAIEAESALAPRLVLQGNQGLLCNNVLHCREAFEDSAPSMPQNAGRTLLRGRYLLPVTA